MIRTTLLLLALAGPALAQDVLVVTPDELAPALDAWRRHRSAQGHEIAVVPPPAEPSALVRKVHGKSGGALRFVLLLGDVKHVPCAYEAGEIIRKWERDPRIAHDNAYADVDGDDLPDLAVGRLPADNVAEAEAMLARALRYEKERDGGAWRRRVNVVAGVAGFGQWADTAIELVATRFLRENVPAAYDLHVTYANERSAFCPPPETLGRTVLDRFNEGALVVTYLGHGSRTSLDRMRFGGRTFTIFDDDSVYELDAARGAPIVFFCACSTGHMDGAPDSLAEIAIKRPNGPVAVYASSRVSMPYANGVLAKELLEAMFLDRAGTVGEALAAAKRRMMEPKEGDEGRAWIETLAMPYEWKAERREAERREHVFLYNLFGDPTVPIALPGQVRLACAEEARPGARLKVVGETPVDGEVLVELVSERTTQVAARDGDGADAFARAYEAANERVRARARAKAGKGRFEAGLEVPAALPAGSYHVRVFVAGARDCALGARAVRIVEDEPATERTAGTKSAPETE